MPLGSAWGRCPTFGTPCSLAMTLHIFTQGERERERERREDIFGLAYEGKDIVFRFIMEYSSLMDFGP